MRQPLRRQAKSSRLTDDDHARYMSAGAATLAECDRRIAAGAGDDPRPRRAYQRHVYGAGEPATPPRHKRPTLHERIAARQAATTPAAIATTAADQAHQAGVRDGRLNRQAPQRNYRVPAEWVSWLEGWRAGQRDRKAAEREAAA